MVYLIIYFALFAIWITAELLLAPKGFEDDEGFHFGSPKDDKPKSYSVKKETDKLMAVKKGKFRLQI